MAHRALAPPSAARAGGVGCCRTGLADKPYGIATPWPGGVDFGDGIARHPTQLYEIGALVFLGVLTGTCGKRLTTDGDRFKLFMVAYLAFRLLLDFFKPGLPVYGLTTIQWACVIGLGYYTPQIPRLVSGARHE